MVGLILTLGAGTASAAKQPIAYFGNDGGSQTGTLGGQFDYAYGIAVNSSGAGPAEAGDIYVVDSGNHRIQRFAQDGNGTPADPYDDTYPFVSVWGAGVDSSLAGSDYEICTVAANCTKGIPSGANGALQFPRGIAVDQDTGIVYVSDTYNNRVSVYSGDGTFLRSFGWDVVQSGPGDTGTGYEICVAANGDVCKAGLYGEGLGEFGENSVFGIAISTADGNPASGTVYVADGRNHRVNTFNLDGSSPASFGSATNFTDLQQPTPEAVAVDSRGIVYAQDSENGGEIERYDSLNANGNGVGFLAPIAAETTRVRGGPGNGVGSNPYGITFVGPLRRFDVGQLTVSDGTAPLSGGTGASVTTTTQGGPGTDEVQKLTVAATAGQFRLTFDGQTTGDLPFDASSRKVQVALEQLSTVPSAPLAHDTNPGGAVNVSLGLEVDPDSDGPGPDADTLYVLRLAGNKTPIVVQQFGPLNAPGLAVPPSGQDDAHGAAARFGSLDGLGYPTGLGVDILSGRLFVGVAPSFEFGGTHGVYVLDTAGSPPTATLDSVSDVTERSATIHATVEPNGGPPVSYRLEYSLDGTNWKSTPETLVGVQETPVPITAVLDPPPSGLDPGAFYHVRVRVTKAFAPPLTTSELTFTTSTSPPAVETTGAPIRTTDGAKLGGRVTPRGSATTYLFEYGDQGPCGSNPCTQTPARSAGLGQITKLVSEEIAELQPDTTYHYRLVADNGQPGSPVFGEDMTVRTRASEAPLSHGRLPGPPGSDRAWEQVNDPDIGGNQIEGAAAISDDGSRAVWEIGGGSPLSETGGFNQFYSERTPSGWQTKKVYPVRSEIGGPNWHAPMGPSDLSSFVSLNFGITGGSFTLFRMTPGSPAVKLREVASEANYGFFEVMSDDGSRVLMAINRESPDPAHPAAPNTLNLYDVTDPGAPHMVGLLPGDAVPQCGINVNLGTASIDAMPTPNRESHWVSPDGDLVFFMSAGAQCTSQAQLYVRDIEAGETKLLSGPPVSGAQCGAGLIKSTPDAAFFWTQSRLVAADSAPSTCANRSANATDGDIYRYDLSDESLKCVTCVVPGVDADVLSGGIEPSYEIAVSNDGSRVYFRSGAPAPLLQGGRAQGVYRVDVETGELAYLAAVSDFGGSGGLATVPDGSLLFFRSHDPDLNPLGGGVGNAGTNQLYRYDDGDRSIVCVSCPSNGAPRGAVSSSVDALGGNPGAPASPNDDPLADDGLLAFTTPTPLIASDQNTTAAGHDPVGGTDIYEWRDGKLLLITDGLANWASAAAAPQLKSVSPSGRDILFTAATPLTADATDDFPRLYDARIGGGFEFPKPPPPCPLEVCQGTPKGVPEEAPPGTGSFSGSGNANKRPARAKCAKGKARRKGRCVAKKSKHAKQSKNRASDDRRSAR